jgi:fatty-acyl-CoA synthase
MNIVDWLGKRATLSPNKVALIEAATGREITYREWNEKATQTARFLQSAFGVQKGDRVAILAKNSTDYLDVWMACAKLGAILQNLNWRLSVRELITLVHDASPTVLVYGPAFQDETTSLQRECTKVAHWIALDTPLRPEDHPFALRDESPASLPDQPTLHPDDPWVLCYTGGSTGLPKGAILSHGNVLANAINTVMSWGLDQNDIAVLNAPLFHTGGLNVFTSPLVYAGGTSIVCESFDVEQLFELIKEAGVTVFFGVPTMFILMQEPPLWETADFSRIKLVISGGAPCPLPVFEAFWAKNIEFKTGYGLTEAGPNTFWLPSEHVQDKPGAVGVPLMHINVKVVDAEGQALEANQVGELLIQGPHVTQGYWNRPEATAAALHDGWLHTGDLAMFDEDGYYRIVGRKKEMIISGGENIYPAEIESILHGHDAIAEAAVVGQPDDKWGEIPVAFIRLHDGATLESDEAKAYCKEQLASYKIPKRFLILDELPQTGAGKLDKKQLVAQLLAESSS